MISDWQRKLWQLFLRQTRKIVNTVPSMWRCFFPPKCFCLHNKNENLLPSPESWCRCRKLRRSEAEPAGPARPSLNCTVAMAFFRLWNLIIDCFDRWVDFSWTCCLITLRIFRMVWLSAAMESETIRKECPHETLKNFSFYPKLYWKSVRDFVKCKYFLPLFNIIQIAEHSL